jgi:hypothetical protein
MPHSGWVVELKSSKIQLLAKEMKFFRLTLDTQDPGASLIAIIRRHTEQPIGVIRQNIISRSPIIAQEPHHNSYDNFIRRTETLVADLESMEVSFMIEIDGKIETAQYMHNVFQRWFSIGEEIKNYDDNVARAYEKSEG